MPGPHSFKVNPKQYSVHETNLATSIFVDVNTNCYEKRLGLVGALNIETGEFALMVNGEFLPKEYKKESIKQAQWEQDQTARFSPNASQLQLENRFFDGWALFKVTPDTGKLVQSYDDDSWERFPPVVELLTGFYDSDDARIRPRLTAITSAVNTCSSWAVKLRDPMAFELRKLLLIQEKTEQINWLKRIMPLPYNHGSLQDQLRYFKEKLQNFKIIFDIILKQEASNPSLDVFARLVSDYISYCETEGEKECNKNLLIEAERSAHRKKFINSDSFFKASVTPYTFEQWLEKRVPAMPLPSVPVMTLNSGNLEVKDAPVGQQENQELAPPPYDENPPSQNQVSPIRDAIKDIFQKLQSFESKTGVRITVEKRMIKVPVIISELYTAVLSKPSYMNSEDEANALLKDLKTIVADISTDDSEEVKAFCLGIQNLFVSAQQKALLAIKKRIAEDENLSCPSEMKAYGKMVDMGNGVTKNLPLPLAEIYDSIQGVDAMDVPTATKVLAGIQDQAKAERRTADPTKFLTGYHNGFYRQLKKMSTNAPNLESIQSGTVEKAVSMHTTSI